MPEIHFVVEEAPEDGYCAKAVSEDIFTDAGDIPGLHASVREAVSCHFDEGKTLGHFTRKEVIAA